VVITPLYDQDGAFRGFAKITRDMTEPKRIESLEERERQTNEFLAMLGHELRNPLAAARNALSLMGMRSADDTTREWSRNVIDRQVMQLTRLVDELLDVARITSGKIELKKEPIELNSAVLRAVEACQSAAEARRQILDVQTWNEPLIVEGDLLRMPQIVLNLLNNAIKYTPEGGRIAVSIERDGDWAMLRVKDSGVGILPELLPKVFDLFVQGERTLARTEGGLGIGLTIVRKLVALHEGTVTARSDGLGKGSEFIVTLPALSRKQPVRESATTWQPRKARTTRRVLIVDDNRDTAETAAALLIASGHDVRTVYDGLSALATAREYLPDVVLLDIGLPGMNGYEVARQLRLSEQQHSMLLVAVTGYGQDADRQRSREAGFDHHVVKPLEPATLERIVASITLPASIM
jgi:CheY-like chemotaxis protein